MILQTHWERMGLTDKVPIYYGGGLGERATALYKLFVEWTNERVKKTFGSGARTTGGSAFDFTCAQRWKHSYMVEDRPMVLLATPGMMNNGLSLEAFEYWAVDPRNTVVFAGYCVKGTVGNKVLSGAKEIEIGASSERGRGRRGRGRGKGKGKGGKRGNGGNRGNRGNGATGGKGRGKSGGGDEETLGGAAERPPTRKVRVELEVKYMSFSAHADARGIAGLVRRSEPRSVVLVHGEEAKMELMAERIKREFGVPCHCPANEEEVVALAGHDADRPMTVDVSSSLLSRAQRGSVSAALMFAGSRDREGKGGTEAGAEGQRAAAAAAFKRRKVSQFASSGSGDGGGSGGGGGSGDVDSIGQAIPPAAISFVPVSGVIVTPAQGEPATAPPTLMSVGEAKRFAGVACHEVVFSSCAGGVGGEGESEDEPRGPSAETEIETETETKGGVRFMNSVASRIRRWLEPEGVEISLVYPSRSLSSSSSVSSSSVSSSSSSSSSAAAIGVPVLHVRSLRLTLRHRGRTSDVGGKERMLDRLDLTYDYVDWKLAGRVEEILSN